MSTAGGSGRVSPGCVEPTSCVSFRSDRVPTGPRYRRGGGVVVRHTRIHGEESLTVDFLLVDAQLEPVWASRERRRSATGEFRVVSREGLMRMKAWANRPQDVADIQRLTDLDR